MQKISFHFIDYYRNFNKKDDGNNIHSDLNSGNNGQIRKNSGLNVVNSVDEEEEDDCKTKNLAKYLGMKDGTSVSISSQVKNNDIQLIFDLEPEKNDANISSSYI